MTKYRDPFLEPPLWHGFLCVLAVIFYPAVVWYGALAIEAWWHWISDFVPAWVDSLNL